MWYKTREFNPNVVKDLKLDFIDLLLLRKLIDEYTAINAKYLYVNNTLYVCSSYSEILKNFNIIDFSSTYVKERLQHYIDLDIIKVGGEDAPHLPEDTNITQNLYFVFTDRINGLVHERN